MRLPLLIIVALAVLVANPSSQPASIDAFFTEVADGWVRLNPDMAVRTRYFRGDEQHRLDQRITSYTAAAKRERVEYVRRALDRLSTHQKGSLTQEQRLSADILRFQLEMYLETQAHEQFVFPFNQFNGRNLSLVNVMAVEHPLQSARDASTYIIRLSQVGPRMAQMVAEAGELAKKDLIPPRFILERTIDQMRQFVEMPARESPFVTSLAAKLATVAALTDAERATYAGKAERIVEDEIYPEWKTAIAFLESLVPRSSTNAGLWRFEGGAAAYEQALRQYTTTRLSSDDIHEIGLRQVAVLEKQMDALLRKIGRTNGSIEERVAQLKKDLAYPDTDEGRRQIMADIESLMRDSEKRAAAQFDLRPRSAIVAQPYPRFQEASAAASYLEPAPDGSRPGTFRIPLRPEYLTKFGLRTLVYHEAVPGHHFQLALATENTAVPKFRRLIVFPSAVSVSAEGWALYAERLAAESGWYEGDPEGLLGQLNFELWRARRLVVDTGLHAKRWTREQAIAYGIEAPEVERYIVRPGQACSYMIGQLKILELRDRAKARLKDRFSERAFHNVVLRLGIVPLEILEQEVEKWLVGGG